MCGIGGIITFTQPEGERKQILKRITQNLLVNLEQRGKDASGVALVDFKNDNVEIHKRDVKGSILQGTPEFNKLFENEFQLIMVHTRATTSGTEKENVNNHPHYNKKTKNVLIHNGTIGNGYELTKKHNLSLDGECDSEVILKLMDSLGFTKAVKKIDGTFSIGYGDIKKKQFVLYRGNCSPLYLLYYAKLDVFIFGSTEHIVVKSVFEGDKIKFGNFEMDKQDGDYYHYTFDEGDKIVFHPLTAKIKHDYLPPLDYGTPVVSYKKWRWWGD